jgi:hypothetical protein
MYARGQYVRPFGGEFVKIAPVTMPAINLPPLDSAAIEAEAKEAAAKVRVIRAGRDAWEQIAKSGSFSGWVAVGKALAVGRDFALRVTAANRPEGRRYCAEFSQWIEAHVGTRPFKVANRRIFLAAPLWQSVAAEAATHAGPQYLISLPSLRPVPKRTR